MERVRREHDLLVPVAESLIGLLRVPECVEGCTLMCDAETKCRTKDAAK